MKCSKQVYAFLRSLNRFEYSLSVLDHVWNIIFLDKQSHWNHLQATKYGDTFYLVHIDGELPWEIKRGGNTTHINLSVRRPSYGAREGYLVELCGASSSRLAETVKMVLALAEASKPIMIADAEGIRSRLLAQDNIGIVPGNGSLHRANQRFPRDQKVYDVLHYRSLGRYKKRMMPFITWEPLPVLIPKR